jgi:hypothetical protein
MNQRHHLAVESRADVTGPDEFAAIEDAEHQSAEQVALAFGESAKDERCRIGDFVLYPIGSAARFVEAVGALGDDALYSLSFGSGEEFRTISDKVIRVADQIARLEDFFEQPLSRDEGKAAQILAVEIEKIEGEEHAGIFSRESSNGAGIGDGDAALEELEAWQAAFVESRDFTIENRRFSVDVMGKNRELGVLALHRVAVAR